LSRTSWPRFATGFFFRWASSSSLIMTGVTYTGGIHKKGRFHIGIGIGIPHRLEHTDTNLFVFSMLGKHLPEADAVEMLLPSLGFLALRFFHHFHLPLPLSRLSHSESSDPVLCHDPGLGCRFHSTKTRGANCATNGYYTTTAMSHQTLVTLTEAAISWVR